MITTRNQTLRGFEMPPPRLPRALSGIGEVEERNAMPFQGRVRLADVSVFDAQLSHRWMRQPLETLPRGAAKYGEALATVAAVEPPRQVQNEVLALFQRLLAEADLGIDAAQKRHLREVKRSLNAGRSAGNKLFR